MKILLVGDVMLGRLVNETLKEKPPAYPWGDTLSIFQAADVRICNLECVLSDGGAPARKAFTFRSDAKNFMTLRAAGIGAVSLANNHSLDYGTEALADTLGTLYQGGVRYAGAGRDAAQAAALAEVRTDKMAVGLLAATDTDEPGWAAEERKPGVWVVPIDTGDVRAQALFEKVKEAKQKVDLLVVSLHWGSNWGYAPEEGHREFAHALIDAGADIVFGHSPHVFRGVEIYHKRPIIYSAGNFIDDYAVDTIERNDESFLFVVEVADMHITKLFLYPTVIEAFQARRAPAPRDEVIALKMQNLCRELGTEADWDSKDKRLILKV